MEITVRTDIDRRAGGEILHFDYSVTLKELLLTMSEKLHCSILYPRTGNLYPVLAVNVNSRNTYVLLHGNKYDA